MPKLPPFPASLPPQAAARVYTPLLTAEDVAAILRVHPKTVVRDARQGRLPAFRYGKHWRFRLSDFEAWIDRRVVESTCQPGGRRS